MKRWAGGLLLLMCIGGWLPAHALETSAEPILELPLEWRDARGFQPLRGLRPWRVGSDSWLRIHLPAGAQVRIGDVPGDRWLARAQASGEAPFEIAWSNGSGLLLEAEVRIGRDGLHVRLPDARRSWLLHIRGRGRGASELRVWLGLSARLEPSLRMRPARRTGRVVEVVDAASGRQERFRVVAPGERLPLPPGSTALRLRIPLDREPRTLASAYLTRDHELAFAEVYARQQRGRRFLDGRGRPHLLSARRRIAIDDAGEVTFSREVWVQPLQAAGRQWLLGGINTRHLSPGRVAAGEEQLVSAARDNMRRAAPLEVLSVVAGRGGAVTTAFSAALDQVRATGLAFRELRPQTNGELTFWPAPAIALLAEPDQAAGADAVGDHQLARAERAERGLHAAVLPAGTSARWTLPELAAASELRLFAAGGGRLVVSIDDAPPRRLWLAADEARPDLVRVPLAASEAPRLASATLTVPAHAKRLVISAVDGRMTVGARLALPRPWRGDEDFWRAAHRATRGEARWHWFLAALNGASGADGARWAGALGNAWLPVVQEIRSRARAFADGRHLAIERFACSDDPLPLAEDDWARIARLSERLHGARAGGQTSQGEADEGRCAALYVALAHSLFRVGQTAFAVDYLRTLMLDSGRPAVAAAAESALRDYYRAHGRFDARLTLEAHAFKAHPDDVQLGRLVDAMVDAGHDRAAIELALAAPTPLASERLWPALVRRDWLALAAELGVGEERLADPLGALSAEQAGAWRPAPVQRADGAHWLHDVSTDSVRPRWLAGPDSPVELELTGPAVLRIAARELRSTEGWQEASGRWLRVVDGTRLLPLRLTGGRPSSRFEVRGAGSAPGPRNEWRLPLGQGSHHLKFSVDGPTLLEIERGYRLAYGSKEPQRLGPRAMPRVRRQMVRQPRGFAPIVMREIEDSAETLPWLEDTRRWLEMGAVDCEGLSAVQAARHLANIGFDVAGGRPLLPGLVRAEQVAGCFPGDPDIARELAALRVLAEWREVDDVVAPAGVRAARYEGQRFLHEFMRARALALPDPGPGQRLVPADREIAWTLFNPMPTRIRVSARVLTVDASGTGYRDVALTVDDREYRLAVDRDGVSRAELELPAGTVRLRVRSRQGARGHYLLAALARWRLGHWAPVRSEVTEERYLAEPGRGVEVHVVGPTWLRADRLDPDGTIRYRYLPVGPGRHTLTFDEPGAWRFWVRQSRRAALPPRRYVRPALPVAVWPALGTEHRPLAAALSGDLPSPVAEAVGQTAPVFTWSNGLALRRARAPDETGRLADDDFMALTSAWRRREGDLGVRTEAGLRLRDSGDPTFFARHRRQRRLARWPLTLTGSGQLFSQGVGETTLSGSVALRHSRRYGDRLLTNSTLRVFGRALGVGPDERERDQDVFTRYKFDHRNGVSIAEQMAFSPWLDSELRGRLQLTTNEWHHPDLERLSAELGWRQLLGPVQIELRYAQRYFLPDDDRSKARTSGRLNLELRWHHWTGFGRRWQLTARLGHDVRTGRVVGSIGIERHRGSAQALGDFTADELWHDDALRWRAFSAAQEAPRD